jgi:hypothetical protein
MKEIAAWAVAAEVAAADHRVVFGTWVLKQDIVVNGGLPVPVNLIKPF